jgi:hypothetical protein
VPFSQDLLELMSTSVPTDAGDGWESWLVNDSDLPVRGQGAVICAGS